MPETRKAEFTIGIIGAGKVGGTLARLWYARGYTISAIYSRSPERAASLAAIVAARAVSRVEDVPSHADLTVIAVPDDVVEQVADGMADADWRGRGAVHTCGSKDAGALAELEKRGAMTGGLHPAFPFADVETAIMGLLGAAFAVEAAPQTPLSAWLVDLVAALDGKLISIPPGGKALYHAALVIASNYTVTLYAVAESLLRQLGADHPTAEAALNPLVGGTVDNLAVHGVPAALTGPLTRLDTATIGSHLRALAAVDTSLVEMYRGLARLSYPMLKLRGLTPEPIESLFSQDSDHANDNT